MTPSPPAPAGFKPAVGQMCEGKPIAFSKWAGREILRGKFESNGWVQDSAVLKLDDGDLAFVALSSLRPSARAEAIPEDVAALLVQLRKHDPGGVVESKGGELYRFWCSNGNSGNHAPCYGEWSDDSFREMLAGAYSRGDKAMLSKAIAESRVWPREDARKLVGTPEARREEKAPEPTLPPPEFCVDCEASAALNDCGQCVYCERRASSKSDSFGLARDESDLSERIAASRLRSESGRERAGEKGAPWDWDVSESPECFSTSSWSGR